MFKLDDDAPIRVLIRKHLDFKGRVDRKRYLHYRLFSILPVCLIVWLQHLASQGGSDAALYLILACLIAIILIPVDFSYMIRRYHDLGKSGWFCLINVVTRRIWFLGLIVEIFLCWKPSAPEKELE